MAKTWFEIYGRGPDQDEPVLLCKVRSEGLAVLIKQFLEEYYYDVEVR